MTTQSVTKFNCNLIVTELRNSNCDNSKTQMGQNSKMQIVTQIKKCKCKKTHNSICSKTKIATKLILNLKWQQNSKH